MSVFPLQQAPFLAVCVFLPAEVNRIFNPAASGPFLILCGLGGCSFPLILITGQSNTKECLRGSPILEHTRP